MQHFGEWRWLRRYNHRLIISYFAKHPDTQIGRKHSSRRYRHIYAKQKQTDPQEQPEMLRSLWVRLEAAPHAQTKRNRRTTQHYFSNQ
jgi:hypothetical protein